LALGFLRLAGSSFHIFLFRQFFSSIPIELEDAAAIDGCSPFGTFLRIIVPNSQTAFTPERFLPSNGRGRLSPAAPLFTRGEIYDVRCAVNWVAPAIRRIMRKIFRYNWRERYIMCSTGDYLFLAQKFIIKGVITTGLKG